MRKRQSQILVVALGVLILFLVMQKSHQTTVGKATQPMLICTAEVCDGGDNDCDGAVDEPPACARSCAEIWHCVDGKNLALQTTSCAWEKRSLCANGCVIGENHCR